MNANKSMMRISAFALASLALMSANVFAQPAPAAAPKPVKQSAAPAQDWTGVWKRQGTFAFDPTATPEKRVYPPYKPDWQARYEEALASAERGEFNADPTAACLPPGMPRVMNMVYPMEIIQKPKQMTIVAEWMGQVRRIYLDGRPHPEDPDPTYNGHSIGHWEGKTLVVDTVGLRDDTMFDQSGVRHSDKLRIVERFTLIDANTLEDELTAHDPVAFTKPWTVKKTYKRAAPTEEIMEYVCQENNRNPIGPDGKVQTILQSGTKPK